MPRYSGPADVLQTDEFEYVIFLTRSSSQMKFLYAMIDQNSNTIAPKLEKVVWPRLLDTIHYSVCVLKNVLYVTGGREKSSGRYLKRTMKYDPVTARWLECSSMRTARARHVALPYNGKVFVMGGRTKSNELTDKCESYEPLTDEWHAEPNLPGARCDHSAVTHQGLVYVTGGVSPTQSANDNIWVMRRHWPDPTKPESYECIWEYLQDSVQNHMTYKLTNHTAAICHDRLFIMGGICLGQTADGQTFAKSSDVEGGIVKLLNGETAPAKNLIGTCALLQGCRLGLSYVPPADTKIQDKDSNKKKEKDGWRHRRKREKEEENTSPVEKPKSRWIQNLPDLPGPRGGAGSVVIGHKIYLAGGHELEDEKVVSINTSTYFHMKKRQWFPGFSLGSGDFREVQCVTLSIPKSNRDFRPMKYSECKWVMW